MEATRNDATTTILPISDSPNVLSWRGQGHSAATNLR